MKKFSNLYNKFLRLTYLKFLICLFFYFVSYTLVFGRGDSAYTLPTYQLKVTNYTYTPDSFEFDIYLRHTNPNQTNFELAGHSYFFKINPDLLPQGATFTYRYVTNANGDTLSGLPFNFRPRNPSTAGNLLRLATNSLPGAGNGYTVDTAGLGVRVLRMRVGLSTGTFNTNVPYYFNIQDTVTQGAFFTKINAYTGLNNTTNTQISYRMFHLVDSTITSAYVNFSSSVTNITMGESVNFYDQSYSASGIFSRKWIFEGGNPSTSTEVNPAGIVYSSAGVFDVTLQVLYVNGGGDTITKNGYITVNNNSTCSITWQSFIKATDAGNIKDSLKFGMSPQGTDLIDTCLGESIIPPAPPAGIFDYRFVLSNNDGVKTDFRTDTALSKTWKMNFQPSVSGYPITFTWNNVNFPVDGSFYLKDITGVIVNVNMRNQNSYMLTNSAVNSLNIVYTYNTTRNISVLSGWNIISVPLNVPDMSVAGIFPGAASPAYSYNNGYINSTTLSNGKGYWLKFNSAGNYSVTGLPVNPEHINVSGLWNLIGPFDKNIPVSNIISVPSGLISSYFFGFNDGYIISDTLKAGRGYWIRSNGSGYLKNGSSDNISLNENTNYDDLITLNFSDAMGKSAMLYLSNGTGNIQNADLPPVPPAGIFDVRYSTDKFIESSEKNQIVRLNSSGESIKLKVTNLNGSKFRIKDNLNGSLLNKEISENEEIIINSAIDNFTIINESLLPDTYELSQNFPNPFNPSTTIKYQIPKEGNVKIIIYSVLGKEIMTLVKNFQQAGKYEINFNAVDLSSGIYFYRLESGEFSDLRRMILIK